VLAHAADAEPTGRRKVDRELASTITKHLKRVSAVGSEAGKRRTQGPIIRCGNRVDFVSWGIVDGTRVGYIYIWGWLDTAEERFAQAVNELTQIEHVDALIIDIRFNSGGFLRAPFRGLGLLFEHPVPTVGLDDRKSPLDHFSMETLAPPDEFKADFDNGFMDRVKLAFDKPIAVLVGPGAVSAGDFSAFWLTFHPRVRTFGKSTSSAFNLPTQAALGTNLDLGPDWFARVAEANTFQVGAPNTFLTHTEFAVDEPIWLLPDDVAVGKDTVVDAALRWIASQAAH
jgi:hypothetical protein